SAPSDDSQRPGVEAAGCMDLTRSLGDVAQLPRSTGPPAVSGGLLCCAKAPVLPRTSALFVIPSLHYSWIPAALGRSRHRVSAAASHVSDGAWRDSTLPPTDPSYP